MPENAEESAVSTPQIDTTRAHSARMYDYYLGGKDTYLRVGGIESAFTLLAATRGER